MTLEESVKTDSSETEVSLNKLRKNVYGNNNVAIIGAGPNGLMAGTYLASAGLNVILCERRYEIGGGLATRSGGTDAARASGSR